MTFRFSSTPLDESELRAGLSDPACGGYAAFEGWVRDHNEGRRVRRLEYEAFEPLAIKEGERIIAEAVARFGVEHAACVHRIGALEIGGKAVWVGVTARHRDEAFRACRYIIDEVKHRVPIWKKEHYENGDSGWVNCERCAEHAGHAEHAAAGRGHEHDRHSHEAAPRPDYSRQIALKEVGAAGQEKLRRAAVLVVGCGGLGVPVMTYLAAAGVGRIGLVDGDRLEASNLHRQTLYSLAEVGRPKVELAAARLRALNPEVEIHAHAMRLEASTAQAVIEPYSLVIDCTDNFSSKFMLNDTCVRLRKPVVFSSVYQYEGQLQVVRPDRGGACLRCVWPEATRDGLVGNCAEAGVLGPVPGTFGSLQALEALKLLLDLPGQLADELLMLDLLTLGLTRVRTRRSADCPDHALRRAAAMDGASTANAEAEDVELSFDSLERALSTALEVIDIREPDELARLPTPWANARHLPVGQLLHGRPALPPAGSYLLVCASGKRSLSAARELRSRGYAGVFSLRGGIAALARGGAVSTA
ncbi:MAG: ThiF family adenylyltransferase [Gammaproteobacteria bacterium]|nr:ThiF family adenylyltransferase [Gammaproteobacteria bacterium]MDE2261260.1 ThiF family adenylyltransferase [Gammaproteobacteria bacterium]